MLAINVANWAQQVGAASLMTSLTPSPTMAALVQTAASLPAVLFGLPGGALADLLDRRRWLIVTQLWMLAMAAVACAVIGFDAIGPWSLLVVTAMLGIGFALQSPASQAVIGEVVPRDQMREALALGGVSFNASRVIGPALAGALLAAGGGIAVYMLVALCAGGVVIYMARWRGARIRTSVAPPERLWSALRTGLRYVRHAPDCRMQLRYVLVVMSCGSAPWALLPVVARDTYRMGPGGYGVLLGAFGVGGILGVVLISYMRRRWAPHGVVAVSMLGFSIMSGLLAAHVPLWAALPALVAGGALWMTSVSSIYAEFQEVLPDWVRARAISIYNTAYFLSMGAGAALWGALATPLGTSGALGVAAVAMVLATFWMRRQPLRSDGHAPRSDEVGLSEAAALLPLPYANISLEDEPVMMQYIYRVREDAVEAFLLAAGELGRSCKRNGAGFWRLYRDLQDPHLYVERYMVDSWAELQRQSERMTTADRDQRLALQAFLVDGSEPAMRHYVAQSLPIE